MNEDFSRKNSWVKIFSKISLTFSDLCCWYNVPLWERACEWWVSHRNCEPTSHSWRSTLWLTSTAMRVWNQNSASPVVGCINILILSFYVWKCSWAQLILHQQHYTQLYQGSISPTRLHVAFTHGNPKSVEKTDILSVFCAFGINGHKSCT